MKYILLMISLFLAGCGVIINSDEYSIAENMCKNNIGLNAVVDVERYTEYNKIEVLCLDDSEITKRFKHKELK